MKLTAAEQESLDTYSGTTPNPLALEQAHEWTRRVLATTKMPDLPHLEAIRKALAGAADEYEAVRVTAFINNAVIDDAATDEGVPVRLWLESGRDLGPVLDLAECLKHSS